jgi:ribonuclease HII
VQNFEREWSARGFKLIAGIDEAGRGPLAGPVVSAAVIMPLGKRIPGVNDSKILSPERRRELFEAIANTALDLAVGIIPADVIDGINILEATRTAAYAAIKQLRLKPDVVLTDALKLERLPMPHVAIIDGDARCYSIAAASIVAKVIRDRLMIGYHLEFPQYGFAENKGYRSNHHISAIEQFGASTLHRQTFRGVCWFDQELVRSQTYTSLRSRISSCISGSELDEVRALVGYLQDYLPTTEREELLSLISAREKN